MNIKLNENYKLDCVKNYKFTFFGEAKGAFVCICICICIYISESEIFKKDKINKANEKER